MRTILLTALLAISFALKGTDTTSVKNQWDDKETRKTAWNGLLISAGLYVISPANSFLRKVSIISGALFTAGTIAFRKRHHNKAQAQ